MTLVRIRPSPTQGGSVPSGIALSGSSVAENSPAGTAVGTLASTGANAASAPAFSLVPGPGGADNGSFVIDGRTVRTSAILDFEGAATRSIRVRVSDGTGGALEMPLTIAVTNANDAPSSLALSRASVAENQPAGTTVGNLSATDEDRPGDSFTFALVPGAGATDNGDFQISGGTLQIAVVLDRATAATRTIRIGVSDGSDGTFEQQLTVTVDTMNHPPAGIALTSPTVLENQPAETVVGTLSATDPDPGDTLTFSLVAGAGSADDGAFHIVGSELRTSAPLDFEAKSSYAIRVAAGDGRPTAERPLTITITDADDAPVATDDSFAGQTRAVGNTALVVDDPTDGAPDPAGPQKTVAGDILANDADDDGTGSLAVVAGTFPTSDGGSVDLQSDGDFVFHPAAGASCADHSDVFDYTVSDQNSTKPPGTPATDVGRVTIEIQGCVWYVDGSAAGSGDGTSGTPFSTLAGVAGTAGAGDADGGGDTIFLYGGTYAGGLALEPAQSLLGQRHGLTMPNGGGGAAVTLEPAVAGLGGAASTIAGGLVLAADDTIQCIDLGDAPGVALSGAAVGNSVMNTVTAGAIDNRTGGAVSISGGALDMAFSSVSSDGGTNGIALADVAGRFTGAGGTLAGAAGDDVILTGGSADVTYDGAISDDVGPLVTIGGETAGTKDFAGPISDGGDGDGDGIALTNDTGATIRFRGGLTLATGPNPAFSATGGGTLAVTDPAGPAANTVATTTGRSTRPSAATPSPTPARRHPTACCCARAPRPARRARAPASTSATHRAPS
jgi:large repetitive protein